MPGEATAGTDEQLAVAEEHARLSRRVVETGRMRLRLRTAVEEVPLSAELHTGSVEVERVAIGRELEARAIAPQPREEEDGAVLVVPVLEEVLVVEKRLVLKEELRIRRRDSVQVVNETIALRRQRAEVERLPPEAAAPGQAQGVTGTPVQNHEKETRQ